MAKKPRYRYSLKVNIKATNKKAFIKELTYVLSLTKLPNRVLNFGFGGGDVDHECDGEINHS
jgi:hypothetical protein